MPSLQHARILSGNQQFFSQTNFFHHQHYPSIFYSFFKFQKFSLLLDVVVDEKHNVMGAAVGYCRGYKRFYRRNQLETSDYLKDDTLLVRCCVGVVKSHTEGPKTYTISVPPSNIGQHFGKLLDSGKGTDVNFEVDGETFASHKIVLAARSPVFRAQLFGPMKDQNTQCIKVEDMEAPVFKVPLLVLALALALTLSFTVLHACEHA